MVRDSHYDLDKNRFGGMARVRPGLNGSVKECKVEMRSVEVFAVKESRKNGTVARGDAR